jgi:hypothetical protein
VDIIGGSRNPQNPREMAAKGLEIRDEIGDIDMTLASKGKPVVRCDGFPGGSDIRVSAADVSTALFHRKSNHASQKS